MVEIASRSLRNDTRGVLRRVQHGESLTVTVDGLPVATLEPIRARPRWMPRSFFLGHVVPSQADAALGAELKALAAETTDDIPL